MVTTKSGKTQWRARAEQIAIVLGVGAAGYAAMATSENCDEEIVVASRDVTLSDGETERWVHVRASPENWKSLNLTSDAPVTLEQVGGGSSGQDGSSGGIADSDAAFTSPDGGGAGATGLGGGTGGVLPVTDGGQSQLALRCSTGQGCTDIVVRVGRGSLSGPVTTKLTATLTSATYCPSAQPPLVEVRIEVDDANGQFP